MRSSDTTVQSPLWKTEWFVGFAFATALLFAWQGQVVELRMTDPAWLAVVFLWLFATVLLCALGVVRHADHLAALLGEPYGTLILTLSVTLIEVMSISAIMLHGENNPTLARDSLFAVVMIVLNGMVGLSLLIGAWRHREQEHNLQGSNAYLGVILPLVVLNFVLPVFTQTTPGPSFARGQQIFVTVISLCLYATFLAMQTGRHRGYFMTEDDEPPELHDNDKHPVARHSLLLLAYLLPALYLAEQLSRPVDYLVEKLGAPSALAGLIMAVLVATPEAIGAVRAAMRNRLQRSVNVFLGSVLSTIGLTVPAMVLVSLWTDHPIVLGVEHADLVLLLLTLAVSMVTFSSGRTNVLQGAVHMILFATYILLIVQS